MQMTLQDRDQLLEALRGGQYPQGKHALEKKGAFCCLGVFSALFYKDVGLGRKQRSDGMTYYWDQERGNIAGTDLHQDFWGKFQCTAHGFSVPPIFLTKEEINLLGWENVNEKVPAMCLNDRGFTFARIAELAEKVIVVIDNYKDRNVVFDPNPPRTSATAT